MTSVHTRSLSTSYSYSSIASEALMLLLQMIPMRPYPLMLFSPARGRYAITPCFSSIQKVMMLVMLAEESFMLRVSPRSVCVHPSIHSFLSVLFCFPPRLFCPPLCGLPSPPSVAPSVAPSAGAPDPINKAAVARRLDRSICVRMVLARYETRRTSWMWLLL